MKYNIRNLTLKNRIFLAPMEEINDIAFRLLCKKAGCGLTYTGMINPLTKQNFLSLPSEANKEAITGKKKEAYKRNHRCLLDDKPALQLFCTNTKGIKEFMKKYDKKVSLWDFNLGCPAKTARRHGFGSFLKDLKTIEEILRIMRENTKKPITIKIRKSNISFEILKIAEKYCDAICIHPRTYEQGYSGEPDLNFALRIKSETKLPVIYSGNVNERNCKSLLDKFDFVMIGREAIGRPEIFSKLTNTKFEKSFKEYLKLAKKYKLPFHQIKIQAMNFTKGLRNSAKFRNEIAKIKNIKELENGFFF